MSYPERMFIADVAGPSGSLDELGDWCKRTADTLRGTPGVERIGRYRKLNDVRTLIIAELNDMRAAEPLKAAFASPSPYTATILTAVQRAERRRADAGEDPRALPILYTVGFPVPQEKVPEIEDWYDQEHAPMLQLCPYWVMTRRFHVEGDAAKNWGTHLAVHYLSDIRALRSPERDEARRTPWRDRLAAQPWFRGIYTITLQEN